eukprot:5066767-Ditylum_brightwellii.AAC.1
MPRENQIHAYVRRDKPFSLVILVRQQQTGATAADDEDNSDIEILEVIPPLGEEDNATYSWTKDASNPLYHLPLLERNIGDAHSGPTPIRSWILLEKPLPM